MGWWACPWLSPDSATLQPRPCCRSQESSVVSGQGRGGLCVHRSLQSGQVRPCLGRGASEPPSNWQHGPPHRSPGLGSGVRVLPHGPGPASSFAPVDRWGDGGVACHTLWVRAGVCP